MGILYDLSRKGNVVLKGLGGGIDHNGGEAAVNAGFAEFKRIAMVEVQSNGDLGIELYSSLYQLDKIGMVCVGACALGNLKDDRALQLAGCFRDALDDLHIVDVECTDCISAVIRFGKHFFRGYKCHFTTP